MCSARSRAVYAGAARRCALFARLRSIPPDPPPSGLPAASPRPSSQPHQERLRATSSTLSRQRNGEVTTATWMASDMVLGLARRPRAYRYALDDDPLPQARGEISDQEPAEPSAIRSRAPDENLRDLAVHFPQVQDLGVGIANPISDLVNH